MESNSLQERNAFVESIMEEHYAVLLAYAVGLRHRFKATHADPDELLQQLYLSILTNYEKVREGYEANGVKYLLTMIKNELLNYLRRMKNLERRNEIFHGRLSKASDIFSLCTDIYTNEVMGDLSKVLNSQDWDVMQLYILGYSYKEIEVKTGLNTNTIASKIRRSKIKLAKFFGREYKTKSNPRLNFKK